MDTIIERIAGRRRCPGNLRAERSAALAACGG
jgi:hypothetical protein